MTTTTTHAPLDYIIRFCHEKNIQPFDDAGNRRTSEEVYAILKQRIDKTLKTKGKTSIKNTKKKTDKKTDRRSGRQAGLGDSRLQMNPIM